MRGPVLRYQRGQMKLVDLSLAIGDVSHAAGRMVEPVRDEARQVIEFRAPELPQADPNWEDEAADILHTFRKCLDHIALLLAAVNGTDVNDPVIRKKLSFPILDSKHKFKSKAGEIQRYFRPADWNLIESVALYNAACTDLWGQHAHEVMPAMLPLHLQILSDLDDHDKHRWTQLVWFGLGHPRGDAPMVGGVQATGCSIPAVIPAPGEIIFSVGFDRSPPPLEGTDLRPLLDYMPEVVLTLSNPRWHWPDTFECAYQFLEFVDVMFNIMYSVRTVLQCAEPAIRNGDDPLPLPKDARLV
jgi:hypothetical protein